MTHDGCLMLAVELMSDGLHWFPPEARPDAELLLTAGILTMKDVPRDELGGCGDRGFLARITSRGKRILGGSCMSAAAFDGVLDMALEYDGSGTVA